MEAETMKKRRRRSAEERLLELEEKQRQTESKLREQLAKLEQQKRSLREARAFVGSAKCRGARSWSVSPGWYRNGNRPRFWPPLPKCVTGWASMAICSRNWRNGGSLDGNLQATARPAATGGPLGLSPKTHRAGNPVRGPITANYMLGAAFLAGAFFMCLTCFT